MAGVQSAVRKSRPGAILGTGNRRRLRCSLRFLRVWSSLWQDLACDARTSPRPVPCSEIAFTRCQLTQPTSAGFSSAAVFSGAARTSRAARVDPGEGPCNARKQKFAFDEALIVFLDPVALAFDNPDHSNHAQRFITIGTSTRGRVLFVARHRAESGTPNARRSMRVLAALQR